jgi:hypothetical protein
VLQPCGLKIEERKGRIYVRKADGLCERIPVEVGDQVLKLNDKEVKNYRGGLNEMKLVIKKEKTINLVVLRHDPNAADDDSSESEEEEEDEEYEEYDRDRRRQGKGEDDEDDDYEEYDRNSRALVVKNTGNKHRRGEVVEEEEEIGDQYDVEIKPGSTMQINNLKKKPNLNEQPVHVMHASTKEPGYYECELADGSRINLTSRNLVPVDEDNAAAVFESQRSCFTNLIEEGDIMKIRGLKKQAKMNGTRVEVLRPAEQPGRWECKICDDPNRVVALLAENLRHVM